MRLVPKVLGLIGIVLGSLGLWLAFLEVNEPLPQTAALSSEDVRSSNLPSVTVTDRPRDAAAPWFRPRPPVLPPPAVPKVEPVVAPPPANTNALVFVGRVVTAATGPNYYFKYLSTGQVIGLALGESKNGWRLVAVDEDRYRLEGPGGLYEVRR